MEKEPGKRPGKCESCGLALPYEKGKGAWKYFCSNDGKSRRGGDSCGGYWGKEDMRKTADELMKFVGRTNRKLAACMKGE